MHSSSDLPLDRRFQPQPSAREALVQDRPTLGAMPIARRGAALWLLPAADFVSSSVALAVVAVIAGVAFVPAFPVAPVILVGVYLGLGVYGTQSERGADGGAGWPIIRFLVAALFAWTASLLTPLGGIEQLGL